MPGLPRRLQPWLPLATAAGRRHGVDPFLVLAVLDRESMGGEALTPKGPGGTGDGGNGFGLMQIDRRYHPAFTNLKLPDGKPAWADPTNNIDYGTRLLAENLIAFQGDEALALSANNAGVKRVRSALLLLEGQRTPEKVLKLADLLTTGRNYVTDVLDRRDRFRRALSAPIT